jgi:peptidoglycan/LPS O-acetylase OafA/YrhL
MVSTDIVAKHRFVVLDGMRGLAALAVICDHVPSEFMRALLPARYLAVDFFFVLSGFVLMHVYGQRLASGMSTLSFMRVRLIRLYPLYFLAIFAGAVMAAIAILKGWEAGPLSHLFTSIAFALALLPCPPGLSLYPGAPFSLNGPSWSLFFELFINAVFAFIARWLTPALCILFIAVGGGGLALATFAGINAGGHAWGNFAGGFLRVSFSFFAGVWIYMMRANRRLPALPAWAAFAVLFIALAMPAPEGWRQIVDLGVVLFIFPPLVALSADSSVSGRMMHASAFVGLVSYGVYILHVPLFSWLRLTLQYFGVYDAMPGVALVFLTAAAAVAATALLHVVYDLPVRRFLSRLGRRESRERTGPEAAS